mgnify:CR=1 FL=1
MQNLTNRDIELVYNLFSQITPVTKNDIENVLPFLKKVTCDHPGETPSFESFYKNRYITIIEKNFEFNIR